MYAVRTPSLDPVAIVELRPTQMTVGLSEVKAKRKTWRGLKDEQRSAFFGNHMISVVLGPKKRHYIIDHHHLSRALNEEGVEQILVSVVTNLSALEPDAFWICLDQRGWTHLYDATGKRCGSAAIPKTGAEFVDDPFRSLAGGYAKDTAPFAEFLWADFLRRRLKRSLVEDASRQLSRRR